MKRIINSNRYKVFISKFPADISPAEFKNEVLIKNKLRGALVFIFLTGTAVFAGNSIHVEFNNLSDWEPLNFPKIKNHSRYSIISEKGKNILQCESSGSASGLIYKKTFNVYNYRKLKWKWKISNIYNNVDPFKKSGDDYPLRIYIIFKYDPAGAALFEKAKYNALKLIYGEFPPRSSINYVWSSKVIPDGIITSPFTDRVKFILLEKGAEKVNTWITEEVNILEDYRKAFGTNPPETASLAIMCDSDNTGQSAKAFVEYINIE